MTPQEAIRRIEEFAIGDFPYSAHTVEAFEMSVEALEKQIPKKPEMGAYSFFCPTCKSYLGAKGVHSIYIGEKPSHCTCGQKLNWRLGRYSEGRKDDTTNSN